MGPFTRLADLAQANVGPGDVGHSAFVLRAGRWYRAVLEGRGLDKWEGLVNPVVTPHPQASVAGTAGYTRQFSFDDPDIAIAGDTAGIELGGALPAGAVWLAVTARVSAAYASAGMGTFEAAVGDGTDPDRYTPTPIDLGTEGAETTVHSGMDPSSGVQLTVTITGSEDLDQLEAGVVDITVLYAVPVVTTIPAIPEEEE